MKVKKVKIPMFNKWGRISPALLTAVYTEIQ